MVGGVAGGQKYFYDSIFFKFPDDKHGLYGGDEGAMKASGHELKGLMSYIDCRIERLHFPLMVLIDYRYRTSYLSLHSQHEQRLEARCSVLLTYR